MKNIRADFPILHRTVNGKPLIYCDNAATSQKPQAVLDAVMDFYTHNNASVSRAIYTLAEESTARYEAVREQVAQFIGARSAKEIVFTRGTTESINLIAATWALKNIGAGDEIVLTELEHHSNLVPWQRVAEQTGAVLKFIPVNSDGTLDYDNLEKIITDKTKLVSFSLVSNALGTHNDAACIIAAAKAVNARVLVDGAQSVPHNKTDVQAMGCDFFAFSGHKMMAPTGVGVLYVAQELHDDFPPYQLGGGMVYEVTYDKTTYLPMPHRLEAGTPAVAQVVGLGAAIIYLQKKY